MIDLDKKSPEPVVRRAEPVFCYLKADYDGPFPEDFRERVEFLSAVLGVGVRRVQRLRSPSGRGFHVWVQLQDALPACAIVAAQAILGSDYRREAFNLKRALLLADAPEFWQPRWNVFYSGKFGRVGDMAVNLDDYGSSRPGLKADAIKGDKTCLTIQDVEQTEVPDQSREGGKRPSLVITTVEFPDVGFWANYTSIKNLVAAYGEDETQWVGKPLPLVKVRTNNPQTKQPTTTLWVPNPSPDLKKESDDWTPLVEAWRKKNGAKATARKTARR